jgi:hypothetical protein
MAIRNVRDRELAIIKGIILCKLLSPQITRLQFKGNEAVQIPVTPVDLNSAEWTGRAMGDVAQSKTREARQAKGLVDEKIARTGKGAEVRAARPN